MLRPQSSRVLDRRRLVRVLPGNEPGPDVSRQRAAFTARARCSIFPIPEADTRHAKPKGPDMTTKPRTTRTFPPLPDPPEREPEDMTSFDHLTKNGGAHHLAQHFGHPETTVVGGERYIIREPGTPAADRRFPDLLIAFHADRQAYQDSNSYVISEQGKPPDFVMEIASESTGQEDTGNKRTWYAGMGIPEYWRFDQTGRFHGSRLAGDRLVDGRYEPISIQEVEEEVLQGYSAALGLFVRWERGELRWHDPETGQEIPTFEQERKGRLAEREGRLAEQEARLAEQEARLAAEARVRELEAELAQRQEEG